GVAAEGKGADAVQIGVVENERAEGVEPRLLRQTLILQNLHSIAGKGADILFWRGGVRPADGGDAEQKGRGERHGEGAQEAASGMRRCDPSGHADSFQALYGRPRGLPSATGAVRIKRQNSGKSSTLSSPLRMSLS